MIKIRLKPHIAKVFAATLFALAAMLVQSGNAIGQSFFIGGYGPGIYASFLNKDGSLIEPKLIAQQKNPSFFAFHPKLDILYVVSETMRNDRSVPGVVVAYQLDRSAYTKDNMPDLQLLNAQPVDGDIPCHVAVDATGKLLVVANYTSGSVVAFPLNVDGSIGPASCNIQHQGSGPVKDRQAGPHAHCSVFDPSNQFVFVSDLGADKVFVYRVDYGTGKLNEESKLRLNLPPGSGPRHLAFHPNRKLFFVINELAMTLSSARWDSRAPSLERIDTVRTLPEGVPDDPSYSTAEVLVHPNGKFVYGSNRGANSIAAFSLNESSGNLTRFDNYPTRGRTPRNFRIDPTGKWMLVENQESNSVISFSIDTETGTLEATNNSIDVKAPACIRFLNE